MTPRVPPRQRLASLLIGREVLDVIAEMRTDDKTWTEIRDAICDLTSGEVDVTWQAIQQWLARAEVPEQSSA